MIPVRRLQILLGVLVPVFAFLALVTMFGAKNFAVGGTQTCNLGGRSGRDVPGGYVPWLTAAAARYRLGSRGISILAAIHKVESDFGRSILPGVSAGTNYAGAAGPGQFLAGTWAQYGVDADGDGDRDVYSVPDSVFGSANYLSASGAPRDWYAAVFAYNHADWYVKRVFDTAKGYQASCENLPRAPLGDLPAEPLARIMQVARWIENQRIPYCWGGGHAARPGPSPIPNDCWNPRNMAAGRIFSDTGLDCSGAVRWLLVLSGYPDPGGLRSDALGAAYPSGPGRYVTIWASRSHVFITITGADWGTASANFAHGPAFGDQSSAGFSPSHPPGL